MTVKFGVMNFEELLTKYIRHVGNQEGFDFIPSTRKQAAEDGRTFNPEPFTEEEVEELNRLSGYKV